MCGVLGIVGFYEINQDLFDGLTALQHRGQDAAGMATSTLAGKVSLHKHNGLVRDVFRTRHMIHLKGTFGIGHVRYPTAGSDHADEAQPFYVNSPYGIALAHNGNLTNAEQLKKSLWQEDLRHINTNSDTEVLLNVFAHALQQSHQPTISAEDIFQAVKSVHARCRGAYAVTAMIAGHGIVGFRDPYAIRPLIYGKRESALGTEYMIASESVALDALGFTLIADVAPGEAIYITATGEIFKAQCAENPKTRACIFEYVYLSRPDSIIDNVSVYRVRLALGFMLAEKIKKLYGEQLPFDVVMPIPDTSRPVAFALSETLSLELREGFVKNRYIGRTFIMPGQQLRSRSVRQKLNTLDLEFQGKSVLLVDDSIVRGTTSREIIAMARNAGAKQVYLASAAPEIRYPNVYGIDMPVAKELIADKRTLAEICQLIGADGLIYQDYEGLIAAVRQAANDPHLLFEDSVFTGNYVTGDINAEYLNALEKNRGGR